MLKLFEAFHLLEFLTRSSQELLPFVKSVERSKDVHVYTFIINIWETMEFTMYEGGLPLKKEWWKLFNSDYSPFQMYPFTWICTYNMSLFYESTLVKIFKGAKQILSITVFTPCINELIKRLASMSTFSHLCQTCLPIFMRNIECRDLWEIFNVLL